MTRKMTVVACMKGLSASLVLVVSLGATAILLYDRNDQATTWLMVFAVGVLLNVLLALIFPGSWFNEPRRSFNSRTGAK